MAIGLNLLFLTLLGSVFGLVGGVFFLYNKRLSSALQKHSIPFAAGVLITVSLLGLIPEVFALIGEKSLLIILFSFFGAYLFEYFMFDIHHHEKHLHGKKKISTVLVVVGDTIHNFIDGIAIGVSFFVNPGLGFVTALSTFLHEVPHEIGDFGILYAAKWKKKDIIIVNLVSATATIFGAFLIFFVPASDLFVGTMLSISAGIFLYLGTIDFLPQLGKGYSNKAGAVIPLALGVGIMLATLLLIPHS